MEQQQEEIKITPEPPPSPDGRRVMPAREQLPAPLPATERQPPNPADRRFIIVLGLVTMSSIAVMMLVALILLLTVK